MKKIKFLVILIVLVSCKKTKLTGNYSYLVGEWEWVSTQNISGLICENVSIKTPQTEGFTYRLKFEEKGILRMYKNGKEEKKYRLVGKYAQPSATNQYIYDFHLDNKKKKDFFCKIILGGNGNDTLKNILDIPVKSTTGEMCLDYDNLFVRVK